MKKIIITQYREEACGATIGAWEYHYGVNYNGNYSYGVTTTQESMDNMISIFKQAGYEVQFIEGWKKDIKDEPTELESHLSRIDTKGTYC